MASHLKLFQGTEKIDVENSVNAWMDAEDQSGINIFSTEMSMVPKSANFPEITIAIWYDSLVADQKANKNP